MVQQNAYSPYQPQIGCFLLAIVMFFMCLMPLFLVEAAQLALAKLHLSPSVAVLVLIGIFIGGLINVPVSVIERENQQPIPEHTVHLLMGFVPVVQRRRTRTIIAVNVGGCLIPLALAVFEVGLVYSADPRVLWGLVVVASINIAVCYWGARPVPGVGIAIPAFLSPAVSVLLTWVLLSPDEYSLFRAPVAFVAGVMGPLVGADLLHLKDITKLATPMLSIGGAGTFDGIVLSGLLAAFLV